MTLRFTPRARNDLRDILEYIAKENPAAADRVRRAFLDAAKLVATRPHLGVRNAKSIHYRVEGSDVWIVHIRHSARRPLDEQT